MAALYEQGRIHHVGAFPTLEDQQCAFTTDFDRKAAGFSPDRVDALVWALTELLVEEIGSWGIYETTRRKAEAVIKARLAAVEAGRPKSEPAPGSMEYQALERAGVELERTVITDICRASFGRWDGTRITAGTEVLQNYDTVFRPYVRQNQDWHNSRLDEGGFQVIVTLGTLARYEVERWLTGRGWKVRGPDSNFTSPEGRVVSILHAPHPNARGGRRPVDVAQRLRELLGGDTLPIQVGKPEARPIARFSAWYRR